jgi:RNA polymerase sigma-B factor
VGRCSLPLGKGAHGIALNEDNVSAVALESASDPLEELDGLSRSARTETLLARLADATTADQRQRLQRALVEVNMPAAAQIARRYVNRGIPQEDLDQVAYLALVKAVQGYQDAPDRSFMAYAVPTIRGEIRKYFRDLGWTVRPGRKIQETQSRIRLAEDVLCQQLGRAPRPSELASHLNIALEAVVEALAANGLFNPSSLDLPIGTHEEPHGMLFGQHDPAFDSAEARAVLRPLLANLSDRERQLLEMRFFQGATQSEIGQMMGVTQMQVSRLLSSLMARLRDELTTGPQATSRA